MANTLANCIMKNIAAKISDEKNEAAGVPVKIDTKYEGLLKNIIYNKTEKISDKGISNSTSNAVKWDKFVELTDSRTSADLKKAAENSKVKGKPKNTITLEELGSKLSK